MWSKICNKCKRGNEIDVCESYNNEALASNIKQFLQQTLEELTLTYMQGASRDDALLYYLNELIKNKQEKIDFEFIGDLLSKGVDINYNDEHDENALLKAIELENEELVGYLLENNVNFRQINKQGCCVFHICAKNETAVIMRLIADKFDKTFIHEEDELEKYINHKTYQEKQTPLHYAAKYGSTLVAECLISEYGAEKEPLDNQNRTPLYLAAEFSHQSFVRSMMRMNCCVSFTNKAKNEMMYNTKGQSTLYWIVTKMPDIAREALDELNDTNYFLRKENHYLAPLEPDICKETKKKGDTISKSVLDGIVESENLDLIEHPTIRCLIDVKWEFFARTNAWIDLLITTINVGIWVTFGLWVSYDKRHFYDFSSALDYLRLSLFILGAAFTFYFIILKLMGVYYDYNYKKKSNLLRRQELEEYMKIFIDEKIHSKSLISEEHLKQQNNFSKVVNNYVSDFWNIYDWLTVILLCACIGTHIQDIIDHTETHAVNHIRLMAFAIIFVVMRLLKSSRIIFSKFGTLVMILYYAISDAVVWLVLYAIVLLSFSCAFWMIFGGVKFDKSTPENMQCVENLAKNNSYNCSTISVDEFVQYDTTLFHLYKVTFGSELSEATMEAVDSLMTKPLVGIYIGISSLVLVNIFIALLTATFDRVYEKAEAYIIFQRAVEILNAEKTMNYEKRKAHIMHIRKIGTPYTVVLKKELTKDTDDRFSNLENELKDQKAFLNNMNTSEKNRASESFKKLEQMEAQLSELLTKQQKLEELISNLAIDVKWRMNS